MKTKSKARLHCGFLQYFFLAPLWLQHLHMYFDHRKNSDLFLHGSSIYSYFCFMKLPSSLWWYITVLQLSEYSSSLAATAVESTGKDMASGGRWWSLSADYRMTETCTGCLFRWLKVRLISRYPRWSLLSLLFPRTAKAHSMELEIHSTNFRGWGVCAMKARIPLPQMLLLVVSLKLGREVCIWCDSSQQKRPAALQKLCERQSDPLMYGGFMVPLALFQQTADVGWHCSSSGLRTHLTKQCTFCS